MLFQRECVCVYVCVCARVLSNIHLCDSMDCSPPDSSVHGIFQNRLFEWVAFALPGDLCDPGFEPMSNVSPAMAGRFSTSQGSPQKRIKTKKSIKEENKTVFILFPF